MIDLIEPFRSYAELAEETLDMVITNTPSSLYRKKYVDKSKKIFINEWGITRQDSNQAVSMPIEGPIKSKDDLKNYKVPSHVDSYRYIELEFLINRFKEKKAIGMHLHDVFNLPCYLRGMENFLMDLILDKESAKKLIDITLEHNIEIAKNAIKMGADFIILGDDYGTTNGTIFSPSIFEELMLPGLEKIVSEIKASGGHVIKHCCGDINGILDMLVESGIDAIHPLDQTASMDIGKVQKKYSELVVIGGIDCGELLTNRSIKEVEAETKNILQNISIFEGHIMSSSNTIHSRVKPENYMAMVNIVKKYGKYPITGPMSKE